MNATNTNITNITKGLVLVVWITACSAAPVEAIRSREIPQEDSGQSTGGTSAVDSGTDSEPPTDSGSTGGAAATGGASATGGRATGGTAPATGGAPLETGGSPAATGGAAPCELVTHENGLGQTWQDCVPVDTWGREQAMKACLAFTGNARKCWLAPGCGSAPQVVQAENPDTKGSYLWGYEGNIAGYVGDNGCPSSKEWG